MSKSIEISQIEASLLITYTAFCEKCGKDKDEYHDSAENFSRQLHNAGWRVIETGNKVQLRCPECAKQ